jgi:hypothetical protein
MRTNRQLKKVMVGFLAGVSDREFLATVAEALDLRRNKKENKKEIVQEKTKRKYTKKNPTFWKKTKPKAKPKANVTP